MSDNNSQGLIYARRLPLYVLSLALSLPLSPTEQQPDLSLRSNLKKKKITRPE